MIWTVHSPTPPTRGVVVAEASKSRAAIFTAALRSSANCFKGLSTVSYLLLAGVT